MGKKVFSGWMVVLVMMMLVFIGTLLAEEVGDLKSESDLVRYIKLHAPEEDAYVAVQRLAAIYIVNQSWDSAAMVFAKYRPFFPEMKIRFDKILALLNAPSRKLEIRNLGESVNTEFREYLPIPSADGKSLYFTGNLRPDGYGNEDIFVSEWKSGCWAKAATIGSSINTKSNEGILSISADGNTITLFGHYAGSLGGGDIFYAERTAGGWSEIKHFPQPINSEYWDCDGAYTADGQAFIFSSDRPGGIGEFHGRDSEFHGSQKGNVDLYVCRRTPDGWSEPINLGSVINTPYCEQSPFLHPDGKTLYFSSDGHYGLGRLDIFKTVRLSDTSWTQWSEPVNLGREINTAYDNSGFKINTAGDIAYFAAANRPDGLGREDIYSMVLPKEAKPEMAVISVGGRVTDETGTPMEVEIQWVDLEINQPIGSLKSHPQTGEYFIALPVGKNYGYFASKPGYYSESKNLDLQTVTRSEERQMDITLTSVKEISQGTAIQVNNLFFDFDRSELKSESYAELDRLADFLKENEGWKIMISGHTDNKGRKDYNRRLSLRRAESVVAYLSAKQIDQARLKAEGFGDEQPIDTNDTEQGRARNRRVEFQCIPAE